MLKAGDNASSSDTLNVVVRMFFVIIEQLYQHIFAIELA